MLVKTLKGQQTNMILFHDKDGPMMQFIVPMFRYIGA